MNLKTKLHFTLKMECLNSMSTTLILVATDRAYEDLPTNLRNMKESSPVILHTETYSQCTLI